MILKIFLQVELTQPAFFNFHSMTFSALDLISSPVKQLSFPSTLQLSFLPSLRQRLCELPSAPCHLPYGHQSVSIQPDLI